LDRNIGTGRETPSKFSRRNRAPKVLVFERFEERERERERLSLNRWDS
jgi:hypothetical protein